MIINAMMPSAAAAIAITVATCFATSQLPSALAFSTSPTSIPAVVPEVDPSHLSTVSNLVSAALSESPGENSNPTTVADRYESARSAVADFETDSSIPQHELVYGELSIPVLQTILDAVGVRDGDVFLDIGSGDGALVLGASLLYANANTDGESGSSNGNAIRKAIGMEIVPGLVDRAEEHAKNLCSILEQQKDDDTSLSELSENQSEVQFHLGDIHQAQNDQILKSVLAETSIAVCFATTWSAGNCDGTKEQDATKSASKTSLKRRILPKLSTALSDPRHGLQSGARVVIIDGRLNENDGFHWEGDLKVQCPDTAPYSVASLYCKS